MERFGSYRRSIALVSGGLFLAICALLMAACGQNPATSSAIPTTSWTPTPMPKYTATPAPAAGTEWRIVGPADLHALFFAPGDPLTAYTCFKQGGGQRGPLTFGVSHDGGHTWRFHPTAIPDTDCQMMVSGADPETIAMLAQWSACSGDGCVAQPVTLYRSGDGGATWTVAPPVSGLSDWGLSASLAWVGHTLFVGTDGDSVTESLGQAHPVIAASVNGAALVNVGRAALANLAGMRFAGFFPLKSALYIGFTDSSTSSPAVGDIYVRTDAAAATFTRATFELQGIHVHALAASADGKTLIGQMEPYRSSAPSLAPLAVSPDGGLTWRALPAFPQALYCCYVAYIYGAGDGSVIAETQVYLLDQRNYEATGIYALRPGAAEWAYVASAPSGSVILTISSDANGRPIAAWAFGFGGGLPYTPLA